MGDRAPNLVYYVLCLTLVASSLVAMRIPLGKAMRMAFIWVAIFAGAFILFAFRAEFAALGHRLRAEAFGGAIVAGGEVRIPMADDGHFWVDARLNGHRARFLVDSGATITTVSRETARAAGIATDGRRVVVNTANGPAPAVQALADRVELETISRADLPVHVSARDDTNVLGMNFLSSLSQWGVEGNYLVLRP